MSQPKHKKTKHDLLPDLRFLIQELVDLSEDVAKLEMKETLAGIRRVKRGLLDHERRTIDFKRKIDELRENL